ncbi:hypothetical protein CVT25_003185 [Psilocybe cyanescens]|uniref:RAI1-like domain-containing protein n=1 Tax=Psilocybe cyanescens TaxID=93625 RepID=A0A409XEY1_PSICY|nr:hypothetical protein CVT25_003185 [Psilocybe cyanescens]
MGKHDNYVELNTSNVIYSEQDEQRFKRKLLKFYFQSHLLGVPEITYATTLRDATDALLIPRRKL